MDPQLKKGNAKDFFLNLGAIVALYTVLISLVNLLFTIINRAFPQVAKGYYYGSTPSISWPVATLIIFFPILVLLMWLLEKSYKVEPERQNMGIHKWLTYVTLFISGLFVAGDLIAVIYYFIDGQELTTGFLLKVLVLLLVAGGVFFYYITDIRGKLTSGPRKVWRVVVGVAILGSVAWGFSVIGSPRTQRLYKYDTQKVNDLMSLDSYVKTYYQSRGSLPESLSGLASLQYTSIPNDPQSNSPYEYHLIGQSAKAYQLCAEFNKASEEDNLPRPAAYPYQINWQHKAGHFCFSLSIPVSDYIPPGKLPM
jgi:hypothetical protein